MVAAALPVERRALVTALGREIDALADPDRVAGILRVVPGARTNGAPVPRLRALAGRVPRAKDAEAFERLCAAMDDLARTRSREHLLVGAFIVGRHQRLVKTLPWTRVARWLGAVDNWETCDQLAAEVLATMVDANPDLVDRLLRLARDPDPWQRRLAVATAASVNQRGRAQPAVTRAICEALERDPSPMIRKAVAWARRELAKHDERRELARHDARRGLTKREARQGRQSAPGGEPSARSARGRAAAGRTRRS
ncbi:MAG: DNA alkylation repair protein [Vicinamibacterales bacterium]